MRFKWLDGDVLFPNPDNSNENIQYLYNTEYELDATANPLTTQFVQFRERLGTVEILDATGLATPEPPTDALDDSDDSK